MFLQPDLKKLTFDLYLRRSSDDSSEHQVASIEQQQSVLGKIIVEEGLNIDTRLEESKSAKMPGRPVFNQLIQRIEEGKADGVIVWDLSRLSRNPIDSGTLSWLLQKGKLKAILTPFRTYLPEDNVLLMNIEFGQANQYIRDLSKNVKRGLSSRVEQGWRPGATPEGYINNNSAGTGRGTVAIDPQRFTHVRKMWDMLLTGAHTVPEILKTAEKEFTYRTKAGNIISKSGLYNLFTNPFYYGDFRYSGKLYKGAHTPMITREEYDKAQAILGKKGKQRPKTREFAYTGIIRCGECGAMITAEEKINRFGSHYTYYHCTKQKNPNCSQKVIELKKLDEQINKLLLDIEIPQEFMEWAVEEINRLHDNEATNQTNINKNIDTAYSNCMKRINNLVKLKISPMNSDETILTDADFEKQMKPLQEEKRSLEDKKQNLGERMNKWTKLAQDGFRFACSARSAFEYTTLQNKRIMLVSLGSNLFLKDKILHINLLKPFTRIKEVKNEIEELTDRFEPQKRIDMKAQIGALYASSPRVLGSKDSNLESRRSKVWRVTVTPLPIFLIILYLFHS